MTRMSRGPSTTAELNFLLCFMLSLYLSKFHETNIIMSEYVVTQRLFIDIETYKKVKGKGAYSC